MLDAVGIAGVVQGGGEGVGESDAVIELAEKEESGIGGKGVAGDLDVEGPGREEIEIGWGRSV
jgi:hypothetical protein